MDNCENAVGSSETSLRKHTISVAQYTPEHKEAWDNFVSKSKNGVFLFYRDYMEYHSYRYRDHSLLFFKDGKLIGLMPANINNDVLNSHEGLTFGGIISDNEMKMPMMMDIFERIVCHCKEEGFAALAYKTVPYIYHQIPAEEDLYALFRHNARIVGRNVTSSIRLPLSANYSRERIRTIRKAKNQDIVVRRSFDFKTFMKIEEEILRERHGARPVHKVDEIIQLSEKFPDNIKLFASFKDDSMLAGSIIFENKNVAHAQYAADSDEGWDLGALDLVFDYLITEYYKNKKFFDFGGSTENLGQVLNGGLLRHKEGFGARAVMQDFYQLTI